MKRLVGILVLGTMLLLAGCGGNKARMLQQLEELEQQNRRGEPMLNDSLAEDLVSYFDRHGNANDRMRSRYILGRTYYCLGELPRALELYNEAADCADTTAADCDFAKLSRVYAQRAAIFHSQVQPTSQLEDLRKAEYYAKKGEYGKKGDPSSKDQSVFLRSSQFMLGNTPVNYQTSSQAQSELIPEKGRYDNRLTDEMKQKFIKLLNLV